MKKIAVMLILVLGLVTVVGCSTDNDSKMLKYDLRTVVEDINGDPADGAEVTIKGEKDTRTKTTDAQGVVQFENVVSDSYKVKAKDSPYIGHGEAIVDGKNATARVQLSSDFWIYNSTDGFMSGAEVQDWAGTTTFNEISDGNYDKVFEVESGDAGWSSWALANLSDTYVSDYSFITFKVKSDDLEKIIVSIGGANKTPTIEDGTDLGNGWYELKVPFSEFENPNVDSTQIAFIADETCTSDGSFESGETFYITDVYISPSE